MSTDYIEGYEPFKRDPDHIKTETGVWCWKDCDCNPPDFKVQPAQISAKAIGSPEPPHYDRLVIVCMVFYPVAICTECGKPWKSTAVTSEFREAIETRRALRAVSDQAH